MFATRLWWFYENLEFPPSLTTKAKLTHANNFDEMYTLTGTDEHCFPNDVWVLELARTPSKALAAISSDQQLSLFDPASLRKGPQRSFATSHGNVTTLRVFGDNVVCTAGENGRVEVWDLRAADKVAHFDGQSGVLS